ncbi:MAG: hypothetical protein JSW64_03090 [Candidatus Zixiibacteriota bacterium]|nr:MAG: hypothetical protein JSW64_03090 [candidate division Zixibacteria bacterium]
MKKFNLIIGFLLLISLLISGCGGTGRKDGDDDYSILGSFENTIGFFGLTLYVVMFECLFNMDEFPFTEEEYNYDSGDLSIFDDFYERKRQFELLNFQIDSVFIDFCAKDEFAARGKIDNLNIVEGKISFDSEYVVFKSKLNLQFEYGFLKGTGVITLNSDSMDFNSHSFSPTSGREDNKVIELTANASFEQLTSSSISADNAIMSAFCTITYVMETGSPKRRKEDILLLNFVKDDDFWRFDSADKNLVELLENLSN